MYFPKKEALAGCFRVVQALRGLRQWDVFIREMQPDTKGFFYTERRQGSLRKEWDAGGLLSRETAYVCYFG
jgi:hypothetical protein